MRCQTIYSLFHCHGSAFVLIYFMVTRNILFPFGGSFLLYLHCFDISCIISTH
uniref:Uncharacterized protein n=1 Tax=Rhizophora mucronata TaxID=61149 RepID=A0A2P2QNQ0_RHIMU